jgi:hypothetical protein
MLDQRMEPKAVMEAAAYMILTNGQWPPRGLLSGRWPPEDDEPCSPTRTQSDAQATVSDSADDTNRKHDGWTSRNRLARKTKYKHIIHCGSVRQEIQILSIQEMPIDLEKRRFEVNGVNLSAASAAAAVLQSNGVADYDAPNEANDDELIGAVVDVTFRFSRTPEWLIPGMRFILRDQGGSVSAAGVISSCNV